MSRSHFVTPKAPLSFSGCLSLLFLTLCALFFPSASEASVAGSSSFKGLQSRFHPNSIPTTCIAPLISALSCEVAPWFSDEFTELPLTPSFDEHHSDYSVTRPFHDKYSVLRVHLGVIIGIDAQVTIFVNGKVVIAPIINGCIDVFLYAGINTLDIHVAVGACISIYTIKIDVAVIVAGEIVPIFPPCSSCPPTHIDSFKLALTAAASVTLVPLVCSPPFDPAGPREFIAYEALAVFVGGKIHLTLNFKVGLWIRYSINHGLWVYLAVSGTEIVGAVVAGTNVILVDVIQPGPCGTEIIEYKFTICDGPAPGGVPALPPPSLPPLCPPLELISLDLNACLSLSLGVLIPLDIVLKVGVFDYVVVRPPGVTALKLHVVVDIDVLVNVYLNGVLLSPHPVPAGAILDLVLAVGINVIRIDLIKGSCITHYTCTVN